MSVEVPAAQEPAELVQLIKSGIKSKLQNQKPLMGTLPPGRGYEVADPVGRLFLRVCYWVEVLTSWRKKYHPPVPAGTAPAMALLPPTAVPPAASPNSATSAPN